MELAEFSASMQPSASSASYYCISPEAQQKFVFIGQVASIWL